MLRWLRGRRGRCDVATAELSLRAEADVEVAVLGQDGEGGVRQVAPRLAAVIAGRDARQQTGLCAPGDELLDGGRVQQVAQVVGGEIGVGQGAVRRQAELVARPSGCR